MATNIQGESRQTVRDRTRAQKQEILLADLTSGASIREACQAAKITESVQLKWQHRDVMFYCDFELASALGRTARQSKLCSTGDEHS